MLTVARYLRLKNNIKRCTEMARKAEIESTRLTNWEGGLKYRHLNADEIGRIATILGVTPQTIADSNGAPLFM